MNDDPGFAHFLAEMARVPLLSATEERRLALRVQRGDLAAKERMVRSNLRLVVHIARAYQRNDHGLSLPDLVQEGTFGLVRAVEKFEPQRGLRFSTYATIWIRQSISRAITYKGRAIRLPASVEQRLRALRLAERELAVKLGRDPSEAELADAIQCTKDELRELLAQLHPREQALLELRYGLNGTEPVTRSEAARRLGIRRRDAVRLEELALRRLRATPPAGFTAAA